MKVYEEKASEKLKKHLIAIPSYHTAQAQYPTSVVDKHGQQNSLDCYSKEYHFINS